MNSLGTLKAVGIATLSGFKKVYYEQDTFICEGNIIFPNATYIPEGFWKQVRRLYFDLQDNKYNKLCNFLKEYGVITIEDTMEGFKHHSTETKRIVCELSLKTLNNILEYFKDLTALFDNIIKGNMGYVRDTLGGIARYNEPRAIYLPEDGFMPYMLVYDIPEQPDGFYSLDANDKILKEEVYRLILDTVKEWLKKIHWTLITFDTTRTGISHGWGFHTCDWFQAAIISWYLEKVAAINLCRCGCGSPARPGSQYASTRCANRYRKRKQRNNKENICPTCGRELTDSESKRRVAQKNSQRRG